MPKPEPGRLEPGSLDTDTIAAVATAPGQGGIGIVRLSGPRALEIASDITGLELTPRLARYATFRDAAGVELDAGIALYFRAPGSFTGEDVVELQGHGGPVVLRLVLDAALAQGARLARPGEFTERAFLNGKLDLAQAEAVADLIASASAAAARGAMRSLSGAFSDAVREIDRSVLSLRIYVEAAMDFPDEEVDFLSEGQVVERLGGIAAALAALLADTRQGVLLRDGILIAILGVPNVGKSSLLNRLAGQERAIVSDIPGTTRDLVHAELAIDGLPVQVVDTAGLRESADPVEQEGVRRARAEAENADLILVVEDDRHSEAGAAAPPDLPAGLDPARIIRVLNKTDLSGNAPGLVANAASVSSLATVRVSAVTGAGIDMLRRLVKERVGFAGEGTTFTARRRHVEALQEGQAAIREAGRLLDDGAPGELIAEELRAAHLALGRIVGVVSADELLGEIFSAFCIGK